DAASRTGVGDIRDLIESVRYRPAMARYKIYIIDEVHMLSTQAFNALLKTLEEPPPHVKFIFATTEIRKVPVTVLSRCQRFDLRRVDMDRLSNHFGAIAAKENVSVEAGALWLIARAADGSVRDGLSLLDQAIAHTNGQVTEAQVREMLGLADRAQVFDLFDTVMRGEIATALGLLRGQYDAGADPAVVIQDMLELTHWLTRLKIVPEIANEPSVPQTERVRGGDMAGRLPMSVLTRTWQMLLKALTEVRAAPSPLQAAEMALVRLAYVADLPTPADAIETLKRSASTTSGATTPPPTPQNRGPMATLAPAAPAVAAQPRANPATTPMANEAPAPRNFEDVVALFRSRREMLLVQHLTADVHPVRCEPGRLEFRPGPHAPRDLAGNLSRLLGEWTGRRWLVSVSSEDGQPTLREQDEATRQQQKGEATAHPLVQAVLAAFPGATIVEVRTVEAQTGEPDLGPEPPPQDNEYELLTGEDEL
ncbi:MAG: DNA polymerase III subunit gamma/tau, partial [Alphaproteobacteria bacterium]|nr:DNA polymerase III subunit gamma/tau [Alphaproteobacteria bacterium]